MSFRIHRRSLIRGATAMAAAAAAPALVHRASAHAGGPPKRFVLVYAGISIGKDGAGHNQVQPEQTGTGYDLRRGLASLGDGMTEYGAQGYGVRDDVSVVSGLRVPWGEGGSIPPGGRSAPFHYNTLCPILSGVRGLDERTGYARGPTADQVVASTLAGDSPHRILNYRIQAAKYVGTNGGGGDSGRVSWEADGRGIDPISSPRLAHESLFSGFIPPDSGPDDAARQLLARRRSAVATVRSRAQALLGRMTAYDRERMQRHIDYLQEFEGRLDVDIPPTAACVPPDDPGTDPPIGQPHGTDADGNLEYTPSAGYSNEALRAELLTDLIHMAFVCDLSRVAALRITHDQCFLNMQQLVGAASDAHELSHGLGTEDDMANNVSWHVGVFARLVQKFRDTTEVDGTSMLDNTALVMLFEGGHGYDPESDADDKSHSTENMIALCAGRVGGLSPGRHIVADGLHPVNVTASAMQAVGAGDSLGEVSGVVPELFS